VQIVFSLLFETQEELNAWKSAFEEEISYALGDNKACIQMVCCIWQSVSFGSAVKLNICLLVVLASADDDVVSEADWTTV